MLTAADIMVEPPEADQPFDPRELFANAAPLEMEIGCGKGGFLLGRARACPDRNFFGIEWANKFYKYAADRMARWGVGNVRLMRTDARHFVIQHLPADCLAALHVYHPDPWPKARHHKRRLFNEPFVQKAVAALHSGGRLAIQTDHAEYYEWIRQHLQPCKQLVEVPYADPAYGIADELAGTNFQIKYVAEGRDIYSLACRKV